MKKFSWFFFFLVTVVMGHNNAANAFCGFYVAGGDSSLFNDATQAVLMREGNRTVLSMQNNYDGPPEDFALVIPVPVVLQETNVKTLSDDLFKKLDRLTAPRLVEYWEEDPCQSNDFLNDADAVVRASSGGEEGGGTVTVEAEFSVGEYDIVVLSTDDATALESWLDGNNYNIPDGAGPYLDPYVQGGSYFFVAKVDPEKVTWAEEGDESTGAVLSPLRFHYDTDEFSLPIRLGLINAEGDQDLIVYTLGVDQRYQVANYDNVFIPTNLEVIDDVRHSFGEFYRTLFDEVLEANPEAVVTEYSWSASSCDPCPGPTLDPDDYYLLGADVLFDDENWGRQFVITRLHARYNADNLGEDLVFEEADPVAGGREFLQEDGVIEQGIVEDTGINNFQGRYIIRHPWEGAVLCVAPNYGRWGGPPAGEENNGVVSAMSPNSEGTSANADGADELSDDLNELVLTPIPELGISGQKAPGIFGGSGCDCQSSNTENGGTFILGLLGLVFYFKRQKRGERHV